MFSSFYSNLFFVDINYFSRRQLVDINVKMSTLFSSEEIKSLERVVETQNQSSKLGDIWNANDLNRCIKFLREGLFSRVCLQFSDEILNYSIEIEKQLKKHIDSNVFLLADTSYGSCCVDEVRML